MDKSRQTRNKNIWITLDRKIEVKYMLFHYFGMSTEFQTLNLQSNHVAIAEFGGPIAMTKDKNMVILGGGKEEATKDKLVIFDATGRKIVEKPFAYEEDLVCFEFLEKEFLFVLFSSGRYFLVDPFNGQ
jgi:hypothetical protein